MFLFFFTTYELRSRVILGLCGGLLLSLYFWSEQGVGCPERFVLGVVPRYICNYLLDIIEILPRRRANMYSLSEGRLT